MTDYDIFSALAKELRVSEIFIGGCNEDQWRNLLYNKSRHKAVRSSIELPNFKAKGWFENVPPKKPQIVLKDFRDDPWGIFAKLLT